MLMRILKWISAIQAGELDAAFSTLYDADPGDAAGRYTALFKEYAARFGADNDAALFSAPGRTELAGNHTDHQHGMVLAAAVDMDMIAVAAPSGGTLVTVCSEGYGEFTVDIADTAPRPDEVGSSAALVRGMAGALSAAGYTPRGFTAYIASNVPEGSGLSSSAAYEVLIGSIFNTFCCGGELAPTAIAKFGQYAENRYFGKPCGLMDQTACAVGGIVHIDFRSPAAPAVTPLAFDFSSAGFELYITGPCGSHAGLTNEYASITGEMGLVAKELRVNVLGDADESAFWAALPSLHGRVPDRAILRAMHFFGENKRVAQQASLLKSGDAAHYMELMSLSGRSSMELLQNIWPACDANERSLALALGVSSAFLCGAGASRVHGGGFAGTIQALVPSSMAAAYKAHMDSVFGTGSCRRVCVRPVGVFMPAPVK